MVLSLVAPFRRSLLAEGRFALIAPVAALVAYLPAVVVPYAFMDDFSTSRGGKGTEANFSKQPRRMATRFTLSFLEAPHWASDIDSLRLVRLVSLLGVMLLAVLLYRYNEFGPPSTYFPWVPNPAVLLVLG